MRFRVLGPVEIESDGGQICTLGRRQERCLLAILLLEVGHLVPIDRLCALLWDETPPEHARRAIHAHVARIRATLTRLGAVSQRIDLVSQRNGYLFQAEPDVIDAHRFRALLDQATDCRDLRQRDRLLRQAVALWRGPALHNATVSDRQRRRLCAELEERRLRAVEMSMATGLDLGRHLELLPELARLGAEQPVRQRVVELHMLALYRAGRVAEALDVYRHARTRLADELGLDPGPALHQLHQAILHGDPVPTSAPSSLSSVGGRVIPALLPADLTTFAGRARQLIQLDRLLDGNASAVVISALAGTAGIGKTALAVHWAHRVRGRFPDGQLYVNLRGFDPAGPPTRPGEVVRRFLDALGVPTHRIPASADAQIDLYRSLLADKRVLVVLDNAHDPEQARPLLPGAPGCLTLVTSRNQLTGLVAIDGAQPLALDLLTPHEAGQLLAARLGAERVAAEPDAADELIARCARLPLALAIAAARAATDPELPLAALAAELRDIRDRLDVLTGDDAATDIRAVFACSYRALSPSAARLFRLLGLHPGPDISAAAAASLAGIPPDQAAPLLEELSQAHLLTQPTTGRYTLHDLLRVYATEQTHTHDPDAERQQALHRVADHYLHTAYAANRLLNEHRDPLTVASAHAGVTPEPVADYGQAMAWFTAEHAVLLAAIRQTADCGFDTHTWQLAWALTTFLDVWTQTQDLVVTQSLALDAAHRLGDRPGQAVAHRGLGFAHIGLGSYDDAHAHFRPALELYDELDDGPGQARTHIDIAYVFGLEGRWRDALDHARQALRLYRTIGHRIGQARALNAVGWYHANLDEPRYALACCEKALALFQELGDRRGQGGTWDSLGYIHHQLGNHTKAVTCYENALAVRRELGSRYPEADTLNRLGDAYDAAGKLDRARVAWQHALDIFTELDNPDADAVRAKLDNLWGVTSG